MNEMRESNIMNTRKQVRLLIPGAALLLASLACGVLGSLTGGSSGSTNGGGGSLVNAPGVEEITLTTPESGAGLKPLLAWEPVAGAAGYQVAVYTSEKVPYWAWSGPATSVYLGGGDTPPPEDSDGPILSKGMWWAVLAFDADGRLAGSSALGQISP
jgi:hypothetical protein